MDMDQEEIVRKRKNENVKKCRKKKRVNEEEVKLKTKKVKEEIAARKTNIKASTNELKFLTEVVKAHTEVSGVAVMQNPEFVELTSSIEDVTNGVTQAYGSHSMDVPKVGLTNKIIGPCTKPNSTSEMVNVNITDNKGKEVETPNGIEPTDSPHGDLKD